MDERKFEVIWNHRAETSLKNIFQYIHSFSPQNAVNFIHLLIDFGAQLASFPSKYPLCKHKSFRKRNFRCTVFRAKYIFVYKVVESRIVIHNIIHTSRIR